MKLEALKSWERIEDDEYSGWIGYVECVLKPGRKRRIINFGVMSSRFLVSRR